MIIGVASPSIMTPTNEHYWHAALARYATKNWVDKPTIFAEQITPLLPLPLLPPLPATKLLELAAGQAQDARYFARLGYDVTATDLVDTGLEAARAKAHDESLPITFKIVDLAQLLPFPDASYDVVYSHLGLHYFNAADTKKLFQEIHRVLKPAGILASLFNTLDDPEIQSPDYKKIEDDYYRELAFDFNKRYFSVATTRDFLGDLFAPPLLLDNHGETHKDEIKTLIRLVARKKIPPTSNF